MTWIIVALTIAASLFLTLTGHENAGSVVGGVIPARLSGDLLLPPDFAIVPAWATPVSATLVHAGFIHLGFNMLLLIQTGRLVERLIGSGRLLLLYLVGAYAAAGAQWVIDPLSRSPMIGASGAVSAIFGAYAVFFSRPRARAIGPFSGRFLDLLWVAGGWTILNIVLQVASTAAGFPIAGAAHIGGFLIGMLLARPLAHRHAAPRS